MKEMLFNGTQFIIIIWLSMFFFTELEYYMGSVAYLFMISLFCILPRFNTLKGMENSRFRFAGVELNNWNPLYARGCFRKNAGGMIWADLKGHFCCEIMLIVPILITILYYIGLRLGYVNKHFFMELMLKTAFGIILLVRLILDIHYYVCYEKDFRYSKNKEGIWQPFSFMTRPHGLLKKYNPLKRRFTKSFEELKAYLMKSSELIKYDYTVSYDLGNEEEAIFFTRKDKNELNIFEIIHVREYRDKYIEQYNRIFERYWKEHIQEEGLSVSFIFLFYVDEWTADFGKRFERMVSVDQRKDRYRLAAFIVKKEDMVFEVLNNYSYFRGEKKHAQLKRELLEVVGYNDEHA